MAHSIYVITAGSGEQQVTGISVVTPNAGIQAVLQAYVMTATSGLQVFYPTSTATLMGSITPSSASGAGATGSVTTGSLSAFGTGGTAPYTYAWTLTGASGPAITINSPTSQTTTFTANISGGSASATAVCTITDAASNTAAPTASVSIVNASLSGSISPTSALGEASSGFISTNTVTASPAGGLGPYTYLWSLGAVSGHAITISSPNSPSTTFSATIAAGGDTTATATCTITDSLGDQVFPTCHVAITSTA